MYTEQSSTRTLLHRLERAWSLINTPFTGSRNVNGGHVDCPTRIHAEIAGRFKDTIEIEAALKSGSDVLRAIHLYVLLSHPFACGDFRLGGHFLCHSLRNSFVEIHNVVRRHLGKLGCCPRLQRMRLIAFPIRALKVIKCTQQVVHALWRVPHVTICATGRRIPSIVFTRTRERSQLRLNISSARDVGVRFRFPRGPYRLDWIFDCSVEWSTHQYN